MMGMPPRSRCRSSQTLASFVVAVGALALVACGGSATGDAAAWVGETVVDGDHTTVTNVSGSVWRDRARLVEEASIGVLEGEEPYMLGTVRSVTSRGDTIVVADVQVPIVRVYDLQGRHLRDLGRAGDGPGEYREPWSVRFLDDRRVLIRDDRRYVVHVYSIDGEFLETWPTNHRVLTFTQMVVTDGGEVFTFVSRLEGDERRSGMQRIDSTGTVGELIEMPSYGFEPVSVVAESNGRTGYLSPRDFPQAHTIMDLDGGWIGGAADAYRFERRDRDGAVMTIVREAWDAVSISREEATATQERITAWARAIQEDWTWDLPPIPEHKPAFRGFAPSRSGAVWVLRPGSSRPIDGCEEDTYASPCWQDAYSYDLFDVTGRLLGSVAAPEGLQPFLQPHIDGDDFIAVVEDEYGTTFVNRYRLARPDASD